MGQQPAAPFEPDLSGIPDAPSTPRGRQGGPGARGAGAGGGGATGGAEPDLSGIPDADHSGVFATRAGRVASRTFDTAVLQPVEGMFGMGVGLVTQPLTTISAATHALLDPTAEHLARATEIRTKGGGSFWDSPADFADWGQEMVRAIPIVGPVAGAIADPAARATNPGGQAEDTDEAIAQALGQVAAPAVAGRLLGRVKAQKGAQTGMQSRVPLTRAERTSGAFPRFITDLTERTVAGAGRFAKFRAEQQLALQREADLLATAIDLGERSGGDTGVLVQRAIERGKNALRARGEQLYGQIEQQVQHQVVPTPKTTTTMVQSPIVDASGNPIMRPQTTTTMVNRNVGGAQPMTDKLRQFAQKELARIDAESELIPPQELARSRGILQQIIDSPDRVPFKAMQDARSDMLKIARSFGDPVPGKAGALAKQLAGRMDAAMEDAARGLGGQPLVDQLREANATWEQLKTVYNDRFVANIAKKSPEVIAKYVQRADVDQITMLRDHLPTKTYDALRGRIMRDIIGGAMSPAPSATSTGIAQQLQQTTLAHGVTPIASTPVMNGAAIRKQLAALGPAKVDVLFGKNATTQLEEIAALADRVAPKASRQLPSLMAGGVNAMIFAPLLYALKAEPSKFTAAAVGAAGAQAAGWNAMAQVLTRPQGLTSFRAMLRGMSTNNGRAALLAGLQLTRQLNALSDLSNPEVAEDAIAQAGGRTESQFAEAAAAR